MKGFLLFGGKESVEAKLLIEAAKKEGVQLIQVDPRKLNFIVEKGKKPLFMGSEEIEPPDFAVAAFVDDPSYENIAVLEQLEHMGVLCINRASVAHTTKDKLKTSQILSAHNIPVPKTMLVKFPLDYSIIRKEFKYPLILKVLSGTGGTGVTLVHNENELKNILTIAKAGEIKDRLIIQEYIKEARGKDIRVVILAGKAVTCITRQSANKDEFRSNLHLGGTPMPHELTEEIKDISNRTAKALNLFVGGIDLLESKNGYIVCEANSVPGYYHPKIDYRETYKLDVPRELIKAIKEELSK